MSNTILLCLMLAILVISILWNLIRGLAKSRVRGICILLSAVAAVAVTVGLRSWVLTEEFMKDILMPMLERFATADVVEMLGLSETLNEVVLNVTVSVVSPIICLLLFWAFSIVTWIIFLIISLICGRAMRRHNENSSLSPLRALLWGAVQGLVIVVILMIPITSYIGMVPPVMNALNDSDVLGENEANVAEIVDEYVLPLNENGLVKAYRGMGGEALNGLLLDFKINDNEMKLTDELEAVSSFACNILKLTESKIEDYGSTEAAVFIAIADSFDDSVLLPTIAGEFIYSATDAWLNNDEFFGMARPSLGEDMGELFDPFLTCLLQILHDDARTHTFLQKDFRTVANIISTLSEYGVFANISNTEVLMETLSSNGIIESLITELGKNDSMKVLIPEITNLGMRAIATTLGIPADVEAVYGEFMDDVANALNEVRALPENERADALTDSLATAFDEAGIPIDSEIIACYSGSMLTDLLEESEGEDLTSDDVQAFFALYAMNMASEAETASTEGLAATGMIPLSESDLFAGTVYEGKSEEELQNSGAAVLAKTTQKLAKLEEKEGQTIEEQAAQILQEAYSTILAEDSAAMAKIKTVVIKKPVTETSLQATAALQSSTEMITQKVTLSDLLVDSKDAANKINTDTIQQEAAAVAAIFDAASSLSSQMMGGGEEIKISEVAGTVGTILDSLNGTASFGSEKTSNLFTAVLQSETVRGAANLDMATATQMAQKATEGEVNYSQTMGTVASGVEVFTGLGENGDITEEQLIDLIRNINPQTAGMVEVFVTAERLESYGLSADYAGTSAELISNMFSFMADKENTLSDADYEKEAKALNQILTVALDAESKTEGQKLFGDILPSADETVEIFMASKAIKFSIRETMLNENNTVIEEKYDAFDLGKQIPQDSEEYKECVKAIQDYYAIPENHTEENKLTLIAISALLGISVDFE